MAGLPFKAGSKRLGLESEGAPDGAPSVVAAPAPAASASAAPGRPRRHRVARGVARWILIVIAIAIWIGAVVYPDPRPFAASVARLRHPPVDAQAAADIAAGLPRDYKAIEDFALDYVPYVPAWTIYGLPWYFPTVREVLRDRAGDCQARAVLVASIFEAKGMPYTLRYSFDHVWVDYPGKDATGMEDAATAFVSDSGKGWLASLPDRIPLWSIVKVRVAYHWTPMPLLQKIVLVIGVLLIVGYGERRSLDRLKRAIWRGRRGYDGRLSPSSWRTEDR